MALFTQRFVRTAFAVLALLLLVNVAHQLTLGVFHFGVLVPLLLGCLSALLAWKWVPLQQWLYVSHTQSTWRRYALLLWRVASVLLLVWLISLVVFFAYLWRNMQQSEQQVQSGVWTAQPKAILILGSGSPDCAPSAVGKARLDMGFKLAQQFSDTPVVVTGGKSPFKECSEGEIMGNYLRAQGLAAGRVVQEEASTSTHENMLFSKPFLEQAGVHPETDAVAIVTNHFHAPRSLAIARRAGYAHSYTVGAHTPLATRYNIWLREYFAYISGWLLAEY